jgi:hypothetical protein
MAGFEVTTNGRIWVTTEEHPVRTQFSAEEKLPRRIRGPDLGIVKRGVGAADRPERCRAVLCVEPVTA